MGFLDHFWEILLVLVVALIVFGPKRLPEMGHALGKAISEFRRATAGGGTDDGHAATTTNLPAPATAPEQPLPPASSPVQMVEEGSSSKTSG